MDIVLDNGKTLTGYELSIPGFLEEDNNSITEKYGNDSFGYCIDNASLKVVSSVSSGIYKDEIIKKTKEYLGIK